MSSQTLLAVPLSSTGVALEQQVRQARAAGADLVELRVDRIGDLPAVETLVAGARLLPLIVTVRSADEGGMWTGDEAERVALIERLASLGPGYVDVEHAAWQRSANLRQRIGVLCGVRSDQARPSERRAGEGPFRRAANRLILSHHDFSGTPVDLDAVFDRLTATPAEVIKAVFTAHDATDACRVLAQLRRRAGERKVIALAMGEAGLPTRILARKFGAFLTFACLHPGGDSAPGQLPVEDLRSLYRWDQIGPGTRVYGVVGWPVAHSQGPEIHNAAMAVADIDGVYVPLPVRPGYAEFTAFMDGVTRERELDLFGLSVTLPHKEHALRWLDERGFGVSGLARQCGAANTLTRRADGTWEGDNTDAHAALEALQTAARVGGDRLRGLRVDVLGAGGAARAVVVALREHDCAITIYNRTAERADRLARELRCAYKPWEQRRQCSGDVLINCTSLGQWPAESETPLPEEALRPQTLVFDMVYRPRLTRLLRAARARGCEVVSGFRMFIGQAAAQCERWHGPAAASAVRNCDPDRRGTTPANTQ